MTRVSRLASSIASACSGVPDGVRELAKLGTPGHPGKNDERALHRWVNRHSWRALLPDLYTFPIYIADYYGLGAKESFHSVLLPHEVLSAVYGGYPDLFEFLFTGGPSNLRDFWRQSEGSSWMTNHPTLVTQPDASLRVL